MIRLIISIYSLYFTSTVAHNTSLRGYSSGIGSGSRVAISIPIEMVERDGTFLDLGHLYGEAFDRTSVFPTAALTTLWGFTTGLAMVPGANQELIYSSIALGISRCAIALLNYWQKYYYLPAAPLFFMSESTEKPNFPGHILCMKNSLQETLKVLIRDRKFKFRISGKNRHFTLADGIRIVVDKTYTNQHGELVTKVSDIEIHGTFRDGPKKPHFWSLRNLLGDTAIHPMKVPKLLQTRFSSQTAMPTLPN